MTTQIRAYTIVATVTLCLLVQACGQSTPQQLICLIDMSASVELGAQASQFEALEPLFKQLHRGDSITIIPITGDAMIEAQGNILRFHLSTKRAAYDADLQRLREEVQEKLRLLKEAVERNPYKKTDILGALEMCAEELQSAPSNSFRTVVILSDLLQDDRQFNFTRETRLANTDPATKFAIELAKSRKPLFQNATVYLGFLRSTDLARLTEEKRLALRTFWTEYLRARGAAAVVAASDGTGQVARFLERVQSGEISPAASRSSEGVGD